MNGASRLRAMLTIRDTLPDGLLDCSATELGDLLAEPTLIELAGARPQPLFVSILIHGNEDVGLGAIQRVLRSRNSSELPRSLMLFIGNVKAASQGMRRLEDQPDFNRIWPGAPGGLDSPEARMMGEIHARVISRRAFAAIDLHNNTGRNPHYSVVCSRDSSVIGLASMFTRKAVMFRGLPGTQTASFTGLVPAMTAECGQPGDEANEEAAARFLNHALDLECLPSGPEPSNGLELFHTLGVVRVKREVALAFGDESAALNLDPHLDRLNFSALSAGTVLGSSSSSMPLEVVDEQGRDVATRYFDVKDGELRLLRPATPAMFTVDACVVRQDCLGYLMEPIEHL